VAAATPDYAAPVIKRTLAAGASLAALGYVLVNRRAGIRRRQAAEQRLPVASLQARALVEAVLGRRGERRQLTLDFAPAVATSWELLIDGPAIFPRMLADIEAATSDVHILIFGFKDGEIGGRMRDLLVSKAGEGLGVRILTEASYSQPGRGSKDFYRTMTDGGVQVVANQGAFLDLDGLLGQRRVDWRFDDLTHFDHRKVVVIDGRVAYVGGPGIEDHYADETFHDVMIRLEGPIVAQLQAIFLLSWQFQGGPLPAAPGELDRFFPETPDGAGLGLEILLNNPGEKHLPIATAFRAAVAGAERRLYVVNPYLADRGILRGLVDAARRGVDVRVIVPADPRSLPASAAVRHWFKDLVEAGATVREHPQMAHAKVVLADDTVLLGTANLDALSLRQNWELQLRADDAAFADHVAAELFDKDVALGAPGRVPTGRKERAVNAFWSRVSPVL
jgi:cardiolipin synthase